MWVKIEAERLLRVAFGRDIILCENGGSPTVVLVRLSRPALLALQVELEVALHGDKRGKGKPDKVCNHLPGSTRTTKR